MGDHRIKITVNNEIVEILADILPDTLSLEMLIIAKRPAKVSVGAGHYFQGRQGRTLWNTLSKYGVLRVSDGEFEDDHLLAHGYGITDIVKVPHDFGEEPSPLQYREGCARIVSIINQHKPQVLFFVYKAVLDKLLKFSFGLDKKSHYGFNGELEGLFKCKVFVFPMPGTGRVTREIIFASMNELSQVLNSK